MVGANLLGLVIAAVAVRRVFPDSRTRATESVESVESVESAQQL